MKDNKTKERFIELRAEGWSFNRIAKKLGVSKQTLLSWSREFEYEIGNLREVELESLREKFYLTKQARIEFFGKQLERIKQALDQRKLTELSTVKLFDLLIKMGNEIKEEEEKIRFKRILYRDESLYDTYKQHLVIWKA